MNRLELLTALKRVIPGISKGESLLTGTDSFIFQKGMIKTYNEHLSVTYPLDIGIEGAVKAAEMAKVLEKMQGMMVDIKIVDNSMTITDGITELSMQLLDITIGEMLAELDIENIDWDFIPQDFIGGLALCLPSVSRNPAHAAMTGIRVELNELISCDNIRASIYRMADAFSFTRNFTMPGGAVAELIKIPKLSMFSATDNWMHFMNEEGVIFSFRTIMSEFPTEGIKKMFPAENITPDKLYKFPDQLQKTLERVSPLTSINEDKMEFITLKEEGNKLLVKGKRQYGSIIERISFKEGEWWPQGLQIDISPKYLSDIMSITKDFMMIDYVVYLQAEGFRHVICSVMPKEPVPEGDDIPF